MKGKRSLYPLTRLAIAMGSAALNINSATFRKMAVHEAATIPKCRAEIGGGRRGEMARDGRALMAKLLDLKPEELADAAERLRACADAVGSRFEVTSEVSLGDRRRQA